MKFDADVSDTATLLNLILLARNRYVVHVGNLNITDICQGTLKRIIMTEVIGEGSLCNLESLWNINIELLLFSRAATPLEVNHLVILTEESSISLCINTAVFNILIASVPNLFYFVTRLSKFLGLKFNIGMFMLVDELFKKQHQSFTITFGKPIPWQTFDKSKSDLEWAAWVKDEMAKLEVGSMSGVLDLPSTNLRKSQMSLVIGMDSLYCLSQSAHTRVAERAKGLSTPLVVTSGYDDFYATNAETFCKVCKENNIPYILMLSPGKHSWKYWGFALEVHLQIFKAILEGKNLGF